MEVIFPTLQDMQGSVVVEPEWLKSNIDRGDMPSIVYYWIPIDEVERVVSKLDVVIVSVINSEGESFFVEMGESLFRLVLLASRSDWIDELAKIMLRREMKSAAKEPH